jgi:hypothetical protein
MEMMGSILQIMLNAAQLNLWSLRRIRVPANTLTAMMTWWRGVRTINAQK